MDTFPAKSVLLDMGGVDDGESPAVEEEAPEQIRPTFLFVLGAYPVTTRQIGISFVSLGRKMP